MSRPFSMTAHTPPKPPLIKARKPENLCPSCDMPVSFTGECAGCSD